MNQAPTKEQSPQINQNLTVYLYIQKGGFDKSNPYKRTIPSDKSKPYSVSIYSKRWV